MEKSDKKRSENSNSLFAWHTRERLLTLTGLQPFGSEEEKEVRT